EASIGLAEFEVDLFGRVRNLSHAALQRYLSEEQTQRSVHLSLIAEVAGAYLTLSADHALYKVAENALSNRQEALGVIQKRYELGALSGLDLSQAQAEL